VHNPGPPTLAMLGFKLHAVGACLPFLCICFHWYYQEQCCWLSLSTLFFHGYLHSCLPTLAACTCSCFVESVAQQASAFKDQVGRPPWRHTYVQPLAACAARVCVGTCVLRVCVGSCMLRVCVGSCMLRVCAGSCMLLCFLAPLSPSAAPLCTSVWLRKLSLGRTASCSLCSHDFCEFVHIISRACRRLALSASLHSQFFCGYRLK
jgi:hypothetical protein